MHNIISWKLFTDKLRFNTNNNSRNTLYFAAFDIEHCEEVSDYLLEIGIYLLSISSNDQISKVAIHMLIQENLHITNGRYVANNRGNFIHGAPQQQQQSLSHGHIQNTINRLNEINSLFHSGSPDEMETLQICSDSLVVPLAEAIKATDEILKSSHFIIGHAVADDILLLLKVAKEQCSLEMASFLRANKESRIYDTQQLYLHLLCHPSHKKVSLLNLCKKLKIPNVKYLHNAGNDAFYTLESFARLLTTIAGSEQLT